MPDTAVHVIDVDDRSQKPKWYTALFVALALLDLSLWFFGAADTVLWIAFWVIFAAAGIAAFIVRSSFTLGTFGVGAAVLVCKLWWTSFVDNNTYGWLEYVAPIVGTILVIAGGLVLICFRRKPNNWR